jgi:hypothetical protein
VTRGRDVGGRDQPADVAKAPGLNGALRQFESVTSRSGAGGKSSVCGKPITFQRGLNLNIAFVDAANSCKETPLPAKRSFRQGTKRSCCRAVTVTNDPCSRHCREATKLRPRCLMRVATTLMGNYS